MLKAKPIPYYEELTIPVLLLFGENDLSVHPDAHVPPIREALEKSGNKQVRIKIIPKANHYFVAEWSGKTFAPGVLPSLHEWLGNNVP